MDGIFHDAHEVYSWNEGRGIPRHWLATFSTKLLAEAYVTFASMATPDQSFEVVSI